MTDGMNQAPLGEPGGPSAQQAVSGPAMGLLVTGGVGTLLQIVLLVMRLVSAGAGAMQNVGPEGNGAAMSVDLMSGALGLVFGVIGILTGALIIFGGLQMKALKNHTICMAATIVAMVPCVSPCCLLGLPLGIWALMTINKPEVKAAFTA